MAWSATITCFSSSSCTVTRSSRRQASVTRWSAASGGPSDCSRIAPRVATGEVLPLQAPTSGTGFGAFLREVEATVEPPLDIHVVLDNLSAHPAPPVQRWLLPHPRVQFHFTPTYASWLNLVERSFGLLTEKALRRGSHTSIAQLRAAILAYVHAHNDRGTLFTWVKTADEILDSMRRFGVRVQQVHGQ